MKKIYFFGDSNTFGFDPVGFFGGRYEKKNIWTYIIERKTGVTALNRGMNGREIPHNEMEIRMLEDSLTGDLPFDDMVIMLGLNDMINMASPSAEKITERMRALLLWLKSRPFMDGVKITIVSPPPINLFKDFGEVGRLYDEIGRDLGYHYKKLAEEVGTGFINGSEWKIGLAADGIHFSEKGHSQFAEKMLEALNL